jgi:hypothetical protein
MSIIDPSKSTRCSQCIEDPEGTTHPLSQTFNYSAFTVIIIIEMWANIHCIDLGAIYPCRHAHISTVAPPPEEDEQLSLDALVDDPPAEDDEEGKEEPVEESIAAEIVQAGVVGERYNDPSRSARRG